MTRKINKYMDVEVEVTAEASICINDVIEFIENHTDEEDRQIILNNLVYDKDEEDCVVYSLGDGYRMNLCRKLYNSNLSTEKLEEILKYE